MAIIDKVLKIRITLTEEILGTQPGDKKIHTTFVGSRSGDADKLAEEQSHLPAVELVEKSMTYFHRVDGVPAYVNYMIKGFFKDACSMLSRKEGTESSKLKAYKKVIDGTIFVQPRFIPIVGQLSVKDTAGDFKPLPDCERPIRISDRNGERVALCHSEALPAGSTMDIEIQLMNEEHETVVREWLDYGRFRGLGQWRNSGKGTFTWEEI